MKIHARAIKEPYRYRGVGIFIDEFPTKATEASYRGRIVMEPVDNVFEVGDKPTVIIENTQAQELMDDLWRCGFRPSEEETFVWVVIQTYLEEGVYDCDSIIGIHDNNISAIHHCNSLINAMRYDVNDDGCTKYRIDKVKVLIQGEKDES